jgi:luciferase family oxidoreductase group 1
MNADGVTLSVQGRGYPLRATPAATSVPDLWLLGSSDYSARLAAEKGLPYVFAHHFAGGTAAAIELYRSSFTPSPEHPEPRTFLTVNAVVAPTQEEADRLALPQLLAMLALRTGQRLAPQMLVEEAEKRVVPDAHRAIFDSLRELWVVGDPATARAEIDELAASYGVDEVMVHPVAGAFTGTEPDRSPAREGTLRLLAG